MSICMAMGLLSGCASGRTALPFIAKSRTPVNLGKETIIVYRCGECHTIPGVRGADGVVGPPLNSLARRTYIAGNFPNTSDSLVQWIMSPQSMKPKTAMPTLGLSEPQARNIAAYLETLK
jgi:cytochrome c1